VISDLQSTNGTLLNGVAVGPEKLNSQFTQGESLHNLDRIQVGEMLFEIKIEAVSPNQTEVIDLPQSVQDGNSRTEVMQLSKYSSVLPHAAAQNHLQGHPIPLMQPAKTFVTIGESPMELFSAEKMKEDSTYASNPKADNETSNALFDARSSNNFVLPFDFQKYRLLKQIGSGGMGIVFLASPHNSSNEYFAIKLLRRDIDLQEMDRSRFFREMDVTMKLKHPSIISCQDCGAEGHELFIVMDYCNSGSLDELLQRAGKLTYRRAIRLMNRLLSGVAYAHRQGIIHRDLKPSNVLLHREHTGMYLPKISDFGLAKSFLNAGESGMTKNGSVGGSWPYMPKEQLLNFRFVSPVSDVWAMGSMLYECLTLRHPRPLEKGIDPIQSILESRITPIETVDPEIPNPLKGLISKSLQIDTKLRYQDATEMQAALQGVAKAMGVPL